ELACPPLKALLHIMAYGEFDGKAVSDPSIRSMFTREALFASDWYQERLETKQIVDRQRCERNLEYLRSRCEELVPETVKQLGLADRIATVEAELAVVNRDDFVDGLRGMLGADPAVLNIGWRPAACADVAVMH
ncbi:MAG: hypothetical protein KDB27_31240, partial [Planctomycetales bacterium]|nr:hypothetical protein [Planctomycetales bacterium]